MLAQLDSFDSGSPVNKESLADTKIVYGADNGLKLIDMRGLDYNDPIWEDLLDELTADEIKSACDRVDSELKTALKNAYDNISMFHRAQKPAPVVVSTRPGVTCELHTHPIDSVGLYVPGGSAPLVSTVLMLAVPAQIAECPKVILCSPPPVSDAIVYAATLCGVNDIYTVGGAQAIAAMAYGTETVPKVNKIFGPGNSFVTEAKKQVSADFRGAAIDMPAGPSEVLVIADESANPAFAASDLLSQAEHGPDKLKSRFSSCQERISPTEPWKRVSPSYANLLKRPVPFPTSMRLNT